jgi:hypothetical protein
VKTDREAALRELDALAPLVGYGSPIALEDSKPTRRDLDQLVERVEAGRENGSSSSQGTPADTSKRDLARKLDEARKALQPQLNAKSLHIDDTLCNIAEAHAKFGYEIWTGRTDWDELPRDGRAEITTCQLKIWRKEPLFEKPRWADAAWEYFMSLPSVEKLRLRTVFKNSKTTSEQWKSIFEQLKIGERMNQTMPEKYWRTEPQADLPQTENAASVRVPDATTQEPEQVMDPLARAGADLAARASLLLKTDSFLSRLTEHSPEMHSRVIAGLSAELLQSGFVSGDFAAKLYNDIRPRALSQFPERRF